MANYMDPILAQISRQGNILMYGDQQRRQAGLDQERQQQNAFAQKFQQMQMDEYERKNQQRATNQNAMATALQPTGPFAEGYAGPQNPRPMGMEDIGRRFIQGGGDPFKGMEYISKGQERDPYKGLSQDYATFLRGKEIPNSPEAYAAWQQNVMDQKKAGATKVSQTVDSGQKGMDKLAEGMATNLIKRRDDAVGAVQGLESLKNARGLFDSGMITGSGAEFLTDMGNLLSTRLGFKFAEDPVANTQAYAATMGNQVGQIIKQFGSGTGLSDADREYAEKIVGGKITLSAPAIKKLLDINERAYKNVIRNYNKDAKKAMSRPGSDTLPYDLMIDYDLNGGNKPAATGGIQFLGFE